MRLCTSNSSFTHPKIEPISGAGPGFPVGVETRFGGCRPPIQVLFGENVCEIERIGSHGGVRQKILNVKPDIQEVRKVCKCLKYKPQNLTPLTSMDDVLSC